MKVLIRIELMFVFLVAGFAAGFPVGQSRGFLTGSELALVQADILAREAGFVMPASLKAGQFRVTLKQPKHLSIPIIMLTAHTGVESFIMSLSGEVFAHLHKPFETEELVRVVRAALGQSETDH